MRDDLLGVYLITESTDPWAFAEQIGKGHLFDVKVIATVHGVFNQMLNALQNCHASDKLFQCSLQHIVGVWAMLFDERADAYPAASGSSEASELALALEMLPICLTHYTLEQAPLAAQLREDVIQLLGNLEGKTALHKLIETNCKNHKEACTNFLL